MTARAPTTTDTGTRDRRWPWLRPLVVRTLVNAVTLMLAVLVFSLIAAFLQRGDSLTALEETLFEIGEGEIIDILLFGLSLALLSAFVRPVLTALLGSLLFRTYGLIIVIIDVIVFWLAIELVAIVLDVEVTLPDPRLVWLFVLALGFSLLLFATDTLLGLNRPRLEDARDDQPLWRLLDRLPLSGRSHLVENLRLAQVRQIRRAVRARHLAGRFAAGALPRSGRSSAGPRPR